jgi:hypothetical protein
MWISISQLSDLTGASARTVKKRCEKLERRPGDKNAILLDSKQALPLIYQLDEDDKPDPQKENALLSRERRKKTRHERKVMEGGFVSLNGLEQELTRIVMAVRSHFLAIPNKAAPEVFACDSVSDVAEKIQMHVYESLTDLSEITAAELISAVQNER